MTNNILQAVARKRVASGGVNFSDDFNRADSASLGPNWTESAGAQEILSNAYNVVTLGFGKNLSIYTGTDCNTVNQYVKATCTGLGVFFPEFSFRYTDASTKYYGVGLTASDGTITFRKYANAADASPVTIGTSSVTFSIGDSVGVTLDGIGDNVVVRVWVNPTGALPDSASVWGGAGPDATISDNPGANNVDTGNFAGIGGYANTQMGFDDFSGGDIP